MFPNLYNVVLKSVPPTAQEISDELVFARAVLAHRRHFGLRRGIILRLWVRPV